LLWIVFILPKHLVWANLLGITISGGCRRVA